MRTAILLTSKFDNVFKSIISAGWAVKSSGDVESSTGAFALVEIPSNVYESNEMYEAVEFSEDEAVVWNELQSGWYVSQENELGFIYVVKCDNKEMAEELYAELEHDYELWCNN